MKLQTPFRDCIFARLLSLSRPPFLRLTEDNNNNKTDLGCLFLFIYLGTAKLLSRPTLDIPETCFEIGEAFGAAEAYVLLFPLTRTFYCAPCASLSEKPLEPIATAYLLCIMGCQRTWPGGETRGVRQRRRSQSVFPGRSAVLGLLLFQVCVWFYGGHGGHHKL